ncbi:uncharacterized protein [Musca autumnalis]|uniref:uncharacterized protein n=1 Tax=Musca autumnalis TaxID=221902 RepID=UPI003CEFFADF
MMTTKISLSLVIGFCWIATCVVAVPLSKQQQQQKQQKQQEHHQQLQIQMQQQNQQSPQHNNYKQQLQYQMQQKDKFEYQPGYEATTTILSSTLSATAPFEFTTAATIAAVARDTIGIGFISRSTVTPTRTTTGTTATTEDVFIS